MKSINNNGILSGDVASRGSTLHVFPRLATRPTRTSAARPAQSTQPCGLILPCGGVSLQYFVRHSEEMMTTKKGKGGESCCFGAFLLKGKVQKVKLRRYIESAGRYWGVSGFVINTEGDDGNGESNQNNDVYGEFWIPGWNIHSGLTYFKGMETWIRGQHQPATYTNVKPVPVGTAYPSLARVEQYVLWNPANWTIVEQKYYERFRTFTMVRDDQEAAMLQWERREYYDKLKMFLQQGDANATTTTTTTTTTATATTFENMDGSFEIGAWPLQQPPQIQSNSNQSENNDE